MALRSISANAAWIWRKTRPAGVVVSMGELSARKPRLRDSRSSMSEISSAARRPRRARSRTTRTSPLRRWSRQAASFGPVGVRAGAVLLEDALAARSEESVELAVQDLPRFDGGNAGVADEAHGVPSLDRHEKASEADVTAD